MKRVLFCTQTSAPVGGVQTRLDRLAQGLPRRGWDVVVALARGCRYHDPDAFRRAHPGLPSIELDGTSGTHDGRFLAVERAIRRTRPDVVVPVTLVDPFWVVAERRGRGVREPRLLFGLYEVSAEILRDVGFFLPLIDQAVGVSRLAAELLVEVGGLPRERVAYIPNGVKPPYRCAVREAGTPIRLGFLGRFDDGKRPLDLVELCRRLDERSVPFRVAAVGTGRYRAELEAASAPWRERGVLELLPPVTTEVLYETVYPRLDVCLLFSESEGLPNVPLEAMAHGVVPVTSDFTGRAQEGILRDGETALVFPVGDVPAACDAVARLWADPQLHAALSARGRAELEAGHRIEEMLDGWSLAFDRTLERPLASQGTALSGPRNGRLSGVLGRAAAERVRRLLGRQFQQPDASEWPHCRGLGRREVPLRPRIAAVEASDGPATWRPIWEAGVGLR